MPSIAHPVHQGSNQIEDSHDMGMPSLVINNETPAPGGEDEDLLSSQQQHTYL